jgi:DNA-binding GntR family transcriptional regulator
MTQRVNREEKGVTRKKGANEGDAAAGERDLPIRRQTVVAMAADRLREKILRGGYPEGQALRQDALASELGVSRIPIREALRQLEVEGLVTFSPHVGAVVSTLSLGEIMELFEMRALLETELLRRSVPEITSVDLERAADILEAYEAAFKAGDVATWGDLNWRFHSTLLGATDRPLTIGLLQTLHNQSDRYTRLQLSLTHGESRAAEEHRAILQATREQDIDAACALLHAHILDAGHSLVDFLRVHRSAKGTRRELA